MDHPSTSPSPATDHGPRHVGRRALVGTGLAASFAAAGTLVPPTASATTRAGMAASDPSDRDVVLVGANPGLQLFDGDEVTAYVSAWRVDWSTHGTGSAVILWHEGRVHLYGADRSLAHWLERDFTRHFPEVAGLPWPDPVFHRRNADVDIDLATGARVRAGEVHVTWGEVRDQRSFTTDDFPLGGVPHSLHLVLGPSFRAHGRVGGSIMEGEIATSGTSDRPSSSAFVTEAEVWRR